MADSKQYSLKAIETQMLQTTNQQMTVIMSNLMAMIAIERLAYDVTPNTRFVFNDELTQVTISEDIPQEDAGMVTEVPKGKK
jgi:hypothetical protein